MCIRDSIDGINVKDLGIHDLRQLIGNVNQEAILFNDTFRNNISFGVEGATEEDIIHAAKIANAHDFIMQSDHGYDTNIGDRGGRLSGGQRQRISIARALLNKPKIIIADEPTGNLDPETAASIVSLLQAASKEGTAVVMSTHNIHLIDLFPGKVYRCKNRVFSLIDDGERQREMEEEDAEEMAQKG